MRKSLAGGTMLLIFLIHASAIAEEFGATHSGAGDMRVCEDELDALQLVARDATNRAGSANRMFIELDHCKNHPDDHAIKDQLDDCENLKFEYKNEAADVEIELRNIEMRLKAVQLACGFDFSLTVTGSVK